MKKLISSLFVFAILANLFAPIAFAAGVSGSTGEGLGYKDVVLTPSNGSSFANTTSINWKCSGSVFNEKIHGVFGWFTSKADLEWFTISKVYLELYELEDRNWLNSTFTAEEYHSTLFSKTYDYETSVNFSQSGTMKLSPGKYKLVLKVKYSFGNQTICSNTFSVYDNPPQPKYATVTVIHKLVDNGQELERENKQLEPGTHTLFADYPVGTVAEVYGSSSKQVYVNSNGVADTSTVVFQYKLVRQDNYNGTSSSGSSSGSALYRRSNFSVGNYVNFGRFEQDGYYGNGDEDILWLVLAREGDRALLLSAYCLYTIPYHQNTAYDFVPWSDCTLRVWLNNTFLSNAFTNAERSAIQTTTVSTPWMPQFDTWPGSSTEDKVFILSYQEAERYLNDWSAWPTQYACECGALVNSNRGGTTYWWLRSPNKPGKVSIINSSGNLYYSSVGDNDGTVRPAIWVDLNSALFE